MTTHSPSSNWENLYTSDHAKWNDRNRIFSLILSTILGVATITIFIVFFVIINPKDFLPDWIFPIFFLLFASVEFKWIMKSTIVFFNSLYNPPEGSNPPKLIFRRLMGVPPAPDPYKSIFHYPFSVINIANVDDGKFILANEDIHWLGGPVTLIIYDGTGVYIERGNQFSRTLGPGFGFLDRYERVRDIVDLRPQTMRSGQQNFPRPIAGRTKDGIKIEFNIEIKFHILRPVPISEDQQERGDSKPEKISDTHSEAQKILDDMSRPILHPGNLEAIRKAVERTAVRLRDSEYSEAKWREGVWGAVSGRLARYVTQYYLDELLIFENSTGENLELDIPIGNERTSKAGQLISSSMLETIRKELDMELQADYGVTLSHLYITDFSIPQEVNEQYRRLFEVEKQNQIKRSEGIANVDKIWIREEKRAQAQMDLISEIADSFKNIEDQNFTDSVLLSLSSILDQSLEDTAIPSILAKDNLATLQQLRDFLNNKDGA